MDLLVDHFKKPYGLIDSDYFISSYDCINRAQEKKIVPFSMPSSAWITKKSIKSSEDICFVRQSPGRFENQGNVLCKW